MANRFFMMTIAILLMSCASNQPKVVSPPDWYSNSPTNPDSIYFRGTDEKSEVFALANAFFRVALAKESSISVSDSKYNSRSEIIVDTKVGVFLIQGIISTVKTEAGDNFFSTVYKIISPNFLIQSALETNNDKITNDMRSSTVQTNELTSELNKFGIAVQLERKGNQYYCLISVPNSLVINE